VVWGRSRDGQLALCRLGTDGGREEGGSGAVLLDEKTRCQKIRCGTVARQFENHAELPCDSAADDTAQVPGL
jgi:hypothetical protein